MKMLLLNDVVDDESLMNTAVGVTEKLMNSSLPVLLFAMTNDDDDELTSYSYSHTQICIYQCMLLLFHSLF
jgi:hypothetical protein